jgi:hypothetical protein
MYTFFNVKVDDTYSNYWNVYGLLRSGMSVVPSVVNVVASQPLLYSLFFWDTALNVQKWLLDTTGHSTLEDRDHHAVPKFWPPVTQWRDAIPQNGELQLLHRQNANTRSHYCVFGIGNKYIIFQVLPIGFPSHIFHSPCHKNPGCISLLPRACYIYSSSPPWFVRRNIWWEYRPWGCSLWNILKSPVSAFVLDSDAVLSTLSNIVRTSLEHCVYRYHLMSFLKLTLP